MADEESAEFELMPISPLRRLEKRVEKLEKQGGSGDKELYRELVTIVRTNQQIVDELVKANNSLRLEISKLVPKIGELVSRIDEILSYIKEATSEEVEGVPIGGESSDKLKELMEINKKILESNKAIVSSLEELITKIKTPTVLRKPLFPPKSV